MNRINMHDEGCIILHFFTVLRVADKSIFVLLLAFIIKIRNIIKR